jgi:hypothetical protein
MIHKFFGNVKRYPPDQFDIKFGCILPHRVAPGFVRGSPLRVIP